MAAKMDKYREMNASELELQQRELSEQMFRLRFQLASGQTEGLKKLREARKDFARIKTRIKQSDQRQSQAGQEQQEKRTFWRGSATRLVIQRHSTKTFGLALFGERTQAINHLFWLHRPPALFPEGPPAT